MGRTIMNRQDPLPWLGQDGPACRRQSGSTSGHGGTSTETPQYVTQAQELKRITHHLKLITCGRVPVPVQKGQLARAKYVAVPSAQSVFFIFFPKPVHQVTEPCAMWVIG